MFRQMAGRAGRRGFDLMGNIIFLGMPFEKISQLVASDMPVLRLCERYAGMRYAGIAICERYAIYAAMQEIDEFG